MMHWPALYFSPEALAALALVGVVVCVAMLFMWTLARSERWFEDD